MKSTSLAALTYHRAIDRLTLPFPLEGFFLYHGILLNYALPFFI